MDSVTPLESDQIKKCRTTVNSYTSIKMLRAGTSERGGNALRHVHVCKARLVKKCSCDNREIARG